MDSIKSSFHLRFHQYSHLVDLIGFEKFVFFQFLISMKLNHFQYIFENLNKNNIHHLLIGKNNWLKVVDYQVKKLDHQIDNLPYLPQSVLLVVVG